MDRSQSPFVQQHSCADGLTMPSEHYRQLTNALSPQRMARYFQEWWETPRTAATTTAPVCRVLDMKYAPDDHCTLLYQWGETLLIGLLHWQDRAPTLPATAHPVTPLNLWLYAFDQDPALPALSTVLDPAALAPALQNALSACRTGEVQLIRCRALPLRYRPGKRCTLQIDLHLRQRATGAIATQRLYGKLYHHPAKASAVYDEMRLLTQATAAGKGTLRLAEAVAFLPDLSLVLQAPIVGQPLDLLLSQPERLHRQGQVQLGQDMARTAHALAELHRLDLATDRLRPVAADLTKLNRRAATVATVAPRLGDRMGALVERLCAQAPEVAAWDVTLRVGHGDCKPSQFLLGADQVALLDFDHCGMADPAADVGLFLATLRQAGARQRTTARYRRTGTAWASALWEEHFLHSYQAASVPSAHFRTRTNWYEALALLRKAWRGFARSPWSPLPAMLVEEAWCCLD